MKKAFLILTLCLFGWIGANAQQNYNTAVGLRGGPFLGLTLKHFIKDNVALEGLLETRWRGVMFTGLFEIHENFFDFDGAAWYYGAGAHVGVWNGNYDGHPWFSGDQNYSVIGLDGIIGLEYSFDFPLNISVDWKPFVNLFGDGNFVFDSGAFSARYYF